MENDEIEAQKQILPTCDEVERQFVGLIDGSYSRENVANWAYKWVTIKDNTTGNLSQVEHHVWKSLKLLMAADIITEDRPYLYDNVDFKIWYDEFKYELAACSTTRTPGSTGHD